jgi:hypothetical protein
MPTLRALGFEEIIVESKEGLRYSLHWMSLQTSELISKLDSGLDSREWCVQFIHQQLISPQLDTDHVRALSNSTLRSICRAWAQHTSGLRRPLSSRPPVFESFRQAAIERVAEELREVSETIRQFGIKESFAAEIALPSLSLSQAAITSAASQVSQISKMVDALGALPQLPSLAQSIPNLAFRELQATLSNTALLTAKALLDAPLFREEMVSALSLGTLWNDQMLREIREITRLSESTWWKQSALQGLDRVIQDAVWASQAFGKFYDDVIATSSLAMPPVLPTRDIIIPPMTTTMMLGSVQAIGLGRRRDQYNREVADDELSHMEERIAKCLSKVHPRLAQMWRGSWETLRSGSSDCLRQAAHSARETFSQLLHELAPDAAFSAEDVKAHGHNGRATRKMRIARILGMEAGSSRVEYIDKTAGLGSSLTLVANS